jgi:hypothetical protein
VVQQLHVLPGEVAAPAALNRERSAVQLRLAGAGDVADVVLLLDLAIKHRHLVLEAGLQQRAREQPVRLTPDTVRQ